MSGPVQPNDRDLPPANIPCPTEAGVVEAIHDHYWLAFRYINDELTADEVARFESLLAESQPAREAVAAAVLLSQAVELAGGSRPAGEAPAGEAPRSLSLPARRSTWRTRITWALFGAAASLLLVWGLQAWRETPRTGHPGSATRQSNREDLTDLALQWTAVGSYEAEYGNKFAADIRQSDDSGVDGNGSSVAVSNDASDDVSAPEWLLAAVSANDMSPMHRPQPDQIP